MVVIIYAFTSTIDASMHSLISDSPYCTTKFIANLTKCTTDTSIYPFQTIYTPILVVSPSVIT